MAGPEEKTFVTNSEMLEQVLKNQMALLGLMGEPNSDMYKAAAGLLVETDALLNRIP